MKIIFLLCVFFIIQNFVHCENNANVTCADGRVCFLYQSIDTHCDIFFGEDCFPPCDIFKCKIKVENDILCDHFVCTDKPKTNILTLFGGFALSSSTTLMGFFFYKLYKFLKKQSHERLRYVDE